MYAKKVGYKLNPDKKLVDILEEGMLRNFNIYGELYCSCRIITGDKEKDKLIICPCAYHKEEIKEMGHCHCYLFVEK